MNIIETPVTFDSTSGVNSCNLGGRIDECMDLLVRNDVRNTVKLQVSQFLCTKLYDIYRLSHDKTNIIIKELGSIVFDGQGLETRDRISYLSFRNQNVSFETSINLFHLNIRERIAQVSYFQILKYILKYENREFDIDIIAEFETIFLNPETPTHVKMDIADIFLMNNAVRRGNEMLDEVRMVDEPYDPVDRNPVIAAEIARLNRIAIPRVNGLGRGSHKATTVYQDSQNVHTSGVNTSVLKACARLIELEKPSVLKWLIGGTSITQIKKILCDISPNHSNLIDTVITRIEIDVAQFNSGSVYFSLHDVFTSLFSFIKDHEHTMELYLRLIEEMVAMANYCTTGHLSRLINVIQGYTDDDDELCVRISDSQQIRAVVSHYLDTVMRDASEVVMDAMMDYNKQPFYDYIVSELSKRIPSLIVEYGDVQEHILATVRTYTDCNDWDISSDNTLEHTNR
jgi:hypothetical protein